MHAERVRKYGDPDAHPAQTRGVCSLDDCDRPHYAHGYCVKHYKRWRKYGDPLGGSTDWGAVPKWLDSVAVPFTGDACLTFPYSRDPAGYGKLNRKSGSIGAHVYVALAVHGAKPSKAHEACHLCGNGHLGCVNPKHLYWGTRADNMADALAHGTGYRFPRRTGEDAAAAKFSDKQVGQVRELLAAGLTQQNIAKLIGMSQANVSRIKLGARAAIAS